VVAVAVPLILALPRRPAARVHTQPVAVAAPAGAWICQRHRHRRGAAAVRVGRGGETVVAAALNKFKVAAADGRSSARQCVRRSTLTDPTTLTFGSRTRRTGVSLAGLHWEETGGENAGLAFACTDCCPPSSAPRVCAVSNNQSGSRLYAGALPQDCAAPPRRRGPRDGVHAGTRGRRKDDPFCPLCAADRGPFLGDVQLDVPVGEWTLKRQEAGCVETLTQTVRVFQLCDAHSLQGLQHAAAT
jgi:hypothetical protein